MSSTPDLTAQRFGRLTVIERGPDKLVGRAQRARSRWLCRCDCGALVLVQTSNLRNGHTRSCGCLERDLSSARVHVMHEGNLKHGGARRGNPHPLYATWADMIARCTSPAKDNYPRYGGRGIMVCERWRHDFAAFLADVGPKPTPRHTLDRINNDGNYEPKNVRWATPKEQQANRRPLRQASA